MLTSRTWAPASTCWRATASAAGVVALGHQLAEAGRAGDVGPLADVDEGISVSCESVGVTSTLRTRPRSRKTDHPIRPVRTAPGRPGAGPGPFGDLARAPAPATASATWRMWSGVVPQQPPRMLTMPLLAHSSSMQAVCVGRLVVFAEGVGQAGVGIGGDQGVGDARQLGDVRAHQLGAQGAVEPDGERLGVLDRVPERLDRLARQGAARAVGDGAGDPDRQRLVALVLQGRGSP